MHLALKVDVDTYRGTKRGVPQLLRLLGSEQIAATFFFSVGPDNMGRHLLRLLNPAFFAKMLRSNAPSLYGWDIVLRGTLWPGPIIGNHLQHCIRACAHDGHEIGLHAWDHHAWQTHLERMSSEEIRRHLTQAYQLLTDIVGVPPSASAAPAWRCTDEALLVKNEFPFLYNSDCRGTNIFSPQVQGKNLAPQIPTTLPSYDEVIGQNGVTHENFNSFILDKLRPNALNVFTVHAESEGGACSALFEDFLKQAKARSVSFVTLAEMLKLYPPRHSGPLVRREIAGREGWVACEPEPVSQAA